MNEYAAKWEERFLRPGFWGGEQPAPFLLEILPLLGKPGIGLELAMGEGRNALYLAEQGWCMTGLELTRAGLDKAESWARKRGVRTWREMSNLEPWIAPSPGLLLGQADHSTDELPQGPWNVILVTNFLIRPLLQQIRRVLPPGAFLAYETYTVHQLAFEGGPKSKEFLLEPGELREVFSDMDIWIYREWTAGKGVASLLARKP